MEAIAPWWGLLWAIPFATLLRLARRTPDVAAHPPLEGVPVSVIIPARNEAATIENVIRSVLASHHHPLELIVVDDRSTDDTRERAISAAGGDPRCRVVAGAELPPGWFGKPWACHQGAREATGEILVFTDADTTHHPDLIGHTVGAVRGEGLDLLTLTSRQLCLTFWERLVMPQIWALLGWRYPPAAVNRATRPHQVVANGQFIAVPREAYAAIGGHEAVKGEVVEDLALAQRFLLAGKRLRMMHAEALLSTRMYRSLTELVEGWSKNLYLGARQSLRGFPRLARLAPLGLVAGFLFWLLPPVVLASGVATAPALLAVGVSIAFWAAISIGMQIPVRYAIGYPLGAAMALWIALRSTVRGATRVEWRGRVYDTRR